MDIQRFFLIGVTAILSYLLLIEWREFSDKNQVEKHISPIAAPTYSSDP